MKVMFSSANRDFLDLYEAEIKFIDEDKIEEDEDNTKETLEDIKELNPNWVEGLEMPIEKALKSKGFKVNKNHFSIDRDTQATILEMGQRYEPTLIEVNGLKLHAYLTYDADFCYIQATPKNKEWESIFTDSLPKKSDNNKLYDINLADLVETIMLADDLTNRLAYEQLKVMKKEEVLKIYEKYKYSLK